MDRILPAKKKKILFWKPFEWVDLLPYSIALAMVLMEVYLLLHFIDLSNQMK